jgi:aryl-alcohol dehydrogenase-like predicted oxidoreductase
VAGERSSGPPPPSLRGSLRRLKLEQIALYQFHRPDPPVPLDDSASRSKAKIRHIGLSDVNEEQLRRARVLGSRLESLAPTETFASSITAKSHLTIAEVLEIAIDAARLFTSHPAQAAVDRLAREATVGCSDFGDDVATREFGRAGALL